MNAETRPDASGSMIDSPAPNAPDVLPESWRMGRNLAFGALWLSMALLVSMLAWAYFARLDEVTVGQGQVIPTGKVKLIQSLEGGILSALLVAEGDRVEAGQVVARIDDTANAANWREAVGRKLALSASMARLKAEASGARSIDFPDEVKRQRPDLVRDETALFSARQREIGQTAASLERSRSMVAQELGMARPLVAKGALSPVEVLRLERSVNELQGQIDDRRNKFRSEAYDQYSRLQIEQQRAREGEVGAEDKLVRTQLKAPMRGVVKKIVVTTLGGVIPPGGEVMEIVPAETGLLVEAKVRPGDIAFIATGQKAVVKLTAYDYSIYGQLPATVTHISADTLLEERSSDTYYKVQVRAETDYLEHNGERLAILPGMTASVDILTGHKSVLNYLVKPLIKVKQSAMREK